MNTGNVRQDLIKAGVKTKQRNQLQQITIVKIILVICLLILGYLFASNNRYMRMDEDIVWDSWKGKLYYVVPSETR